MLKTLILMLIATTASASSLINVNSLNETLKQQKAGWVAKDTWVSKLSQDELHRMLGVKNPPQGNLSTDSIEVMGTAAFDWRNKDGLDWIGNVLNQGNCGSCVAFATIGVLESQASISAGAPWLKPSFSTNALFTCGGGGCETGWQPGEAADYAISNGVLDSACSPYTSGSTGVDGSCSDSCADAASRTTAVKSFNTPTSGWGGNIDKVKQALAKGPLVTTMRVYTDFTTYSSGIYKHVSGKMEGGHAISIVGYDDSQRVLIIRNSWGKEWGENGFARVSYDDSSGIGAETWQFQYESQDGYVSVESPAENDYIYGVATLTARNILKSGAKAALTQFHVLDKAGKDLKSVGCTKMISDGCQADLDTSTLADGNYEIYADTTEGKAFRSVIRSFRILNTEPSNMSISFTGHSVDLSQPVSGRIEFDIKTTSSPVAMKKLEILIQDKSGKTLVSRSIDVVLADMVLGWRTPTVPNGQYNIVMRGTIPYKGKDYQILSAPTTVNVKN